MLGLGGMGHTPPVSRTAPKVPHLRRPPHAISIRWRTSGRDQLPRQHRFEHFNDAWPYTRSAAAKTRELQCHHKPGGCHARRFACPGCMRKHEISMEGCKAVRCDMHTGELSKAGVD